MLVSDKLRLIFVHVPKTGGNSIIEAMREATDDIRTIGRWHITAVGGRGAFPEWHTYTSFAFVRNPWDRTVSAYAHLTGHRISFNEFLNERDFLRTHMWPFSKSQTYWTHDDDRRQLVNVIGRFEKLSVDFASLCPSAPSLSHVNSSEHKPYREYYTDETRERVATLFAEDITTFGYSF